MALLKIQALFNKLVLFIDFDMPVSNKLSFSLSHSLIKLKLLVNHSSVGISPFRFQDDQEAL